MIRRVNGLKMWKSVSGGCWIVFNDDLFTKVDCDGITLLSEMKVIGIDVV